MTEAMTETPSTDAANTGAATSPLDLPLTFTHFTDQYSATKTETTQTLRQFAEAVTKVSAGTKSDLPWLKLATFGENRTKADSFRNNANMLSITGIECDYDGEKLLPVEAQLMLEGVDLAGLIYTSPSHTDRKPRWRVLCPLSGPMPPSERSRLLARVNGVLGGILSTESFTPSQAYYFGNVEGSPVVKTFLVNGRYLDQAEELDATAQGKTRTKATAAPSTPISASVQGVIAQKALGSTRIGDAALRVALAHFEDVNETHPHVLEATSIIKYFVESGDLDERFALSALESGAQACARAVSGRDIRDGEVQQAYDGAKCHGFPALSAWGFSPEMVLEIKREWLERDFPGAVEWSEEEKQRLLETPGIHPDDLARTLKAYEGTEEDPGKGAADKLKELRASPLAFDELGSIPPRQWLYGTHLVRGFTTVMAAPGGAGKTALALGMAMSLATNRKLLGHHIHHRARAWYYNLEDGRDEMLRRVQAAILHHGIDRADLVDWLFVDSGRDRELVIARKDERGAAVATPDVAALTAEIQRQQIDVMIVDPFVRSHSLVENDNGDMDYAASRWAKIADDANCAVLLLHHTRKGAVSGDADSVRGGSGLVSAARRVFTIGTMTAAEGKSFGIPNDDCWRHIRIDDAKANIAPKATKANWFRLAGVALGNGTPAYPAGDNVQAVEPWSPPAPSEGLTWERAEQILNTIEAGPGNSEQYTLAKNSKTRWAGNVIVTVAGYEEEKAQRLLDQMVAQGVVRGGNYRSPSKRKEVQGLQVVRGKVAAFRRKVMGEFMDELEDIAA